MRKKVKERTWKFERKLEERRGGFFVRKWKEMKERCIGYENKF